jgi:hypothetical protein
MTSEWARSQRRLAATACFALGAAGCLSAPQATEVDDDATSRLGGDAAEAPPPCMVSIEFDSELDLSGWAFETGEGCSRTTDGALRFTNHAADCDAYVINSSLAFELASTTFEVSLPKPGEHGLPANFSLALARERYLVFRSVGTDVLFGECTGDLPCTYAKYGSAERAGLLRWRYRLNDVDGKIHFELAPLAGGSWKGFAEAPYDPSVDGSTAYIALGTLLNTAPMAEDSIAFDDYRVCPR